MKKSIQLQLSQKVMTTLMHFAQNEEPNPVMRREIEFKFAVALQRNLD